MFIKLEHEVVIYNVFRDCVKHVAIFGGIGIGIDFDICP